MFESCRAHFAVSRVVISAHLDDAVLSAFSAITPGSTVVTVLAGPPPAGTLGSWDALTGADDSARRLRERREEDRRALAGIAAVVHLDFADGQYVDTGLLPAPGREAIGKVGQQLDAQRALEPMGTPNPPNP